MWAAGRNERQAIDVQIVSSSINEVPVPSTPSNLYTHLECEGVRPPLRTTGCTQFDQPGIAAQIKWAQANPPDYSYATFCKNVKALGCAGYIVSFLGRRVLYFGRTADTHVEYFPQ